MTLFFFLHLEALVRFERLPLFYHRERKSFLWSFRLLPFSTNMCNQIHLVEDSCNWLKSLQLYSSSCCKKISIADSAVTEVIHVTIRWKFYDVPEILCESCRPGWDMGLQWFEMLQITVFVSPVLSAISQVFLPDT